MEAQLCGLERRTSRGGRDSIDHGPGGHDDLSNAVAGALVRAAALNLAARGYSTSFTRGGDCEDSLVSSRSTRGDGDPDMRLLALAIGRTITNAPYRPPLPERNE